MLIKGRGQDTGGPIFSKRRKKECSFWMVGKVVFKNYNTDVPNHKVKAEIKSLWFGKTVGVKTDLHVRIFVQ